MASDKKFQFVECVKDHKVTETEEDKAEESLPEIAELLNN